MPHESTVLFLFLAIYALLEWAHIDSPFPAWLFSNFHFLPFAGSQ